jgi:hypothetical protein
MTKKPLIILRKDKQPKGRFYLTTTKHNLLLSEAKWFLFALLQMMTHLYSEIQCWIPSIFTCTCIHFYTYFYSIISNNLVYSHSTENALLVCVFHSHLYYKVRSPIKHLSLSFLIVSDFLSKSPLVLFVLFHEALLFKVILDVYVFKSNVVKILFNTSRKI